jgi:uncharacterized membrane protein YqjE
MPETEQREPGLAGLAGRLARTGLGAVRNRIELFAVEWQEERARLTELIIWLAGLLFLGMLGVLLLTFTIIFLFPPEYRLYVAGAFTLLYLIGAGVALAGVKSVLKHEPFSETIDQARKDGAWLDS